MAKSESALKENIVSFINPKKDQQKIKTEVWNKADIKKLFKTPFKRFAF